MEQCMLCSATVYRRELTEISSTAQPTTTIYTSGGNRSQTIEPDPKTRDRSLHVRQDADCTITKTSTTTYGQTYTFAPADETSTYTQYTEFSQATTTTTSSGGTAYAIATSLTTTPGACGPTVNATSPSSTATTTQDARCAPTALISAAGPGASATGRQYGLSYSERTSTGATYSTNTTDASACCQLCVDAEKCAASAWDIRTGECSLAFPVEFGTGELSCGLGLQAYYGAGPNHPLEPGAGLFVAEVCGSVAFANAKPDDGT